MRTYVGQKKRDHLCSLNLEKIASRACGWSFECVLNVNSNHRFDDSVGCSRLHGGDKKITLREGSAP